MAASGFMPCDAPNKGGWMLIEADCANVGGTETALEQARLRESVTQRQRAQQLGTAPRGFCGLVTAAALFPRRTRGWLRRNLLTGAG